MNAAWFRRLGTVLFTTLLGLASWCVAAQPASEEPDWPGRVGRLVEIQGTAHLLDRNDRQWIAATPNYPLTSGDHLVTDRGSRLELSIGSTQVRLDGGTELKLVRIDDQAVVLQLDQGSVALRVSSPEWASQIEVLTPEGRFRPREPGHYRIDRLNEASHATAWRGTLRFEGVEVAGGPEHTIVVGRGQHAELWLQGPAQRLNQRWLESERDAFSDWVAQDERAYERSETARYVSPEMTGWEDLDRHGRWQTHLEYGGVWIPTAVPVGWAPYRSGQWVWVSPWGWTWVDSMRWGFAPFHYGRWVHWGRSWCWVPGHRVARPVFAPALVAWVGGSHVSVGVNIGWIPLGPRDVYYRWDHRGWRDGRRDDRRDDRRDRGQERQPTGPILYANQAVPGAVTTVGADAFTQRRRIVPVTPPNDVGRPLPTRSPTGPILAVAPPAAPVRGGETAPAAPPPTRAPTAPVRPAMAPIAPVVPDGAAAPQPRSPAMPVPGQRDEARDGRDARARGDGEPAPGRSPFTRRDGPPPQPSPGHRAVAPTQPVPQAVPQPQPMSAPRPVPQAAQPAAPAPAVQPPPAAAVPTPAPQRAAPPSPVREAPRGEPSRDDDRRQRAPEQRGNNRERTQQTQ
ncbi:DUF6600 domain-containing protein [Aquabacterium humicola]|uniref:DUF6600 domain-containing protein n=1 Tax=Aquabacterium humicola TaxID=3237377 RepID=UPI0025434B03|nr:DUF6600 domain-containing protein [Rubrivivax pictus]